MEFVDTNVLLYAASTAKEEADKRAAARSLLDREDLALSTQVLGEFYVQATRVSRAGALSHDDAADLITGLARYPIQGVTTEIVTRAIATSRRFRISYWDAAIIEAARELGCSVVLSEDLADGQDYDGVKVANPFR